MDHFAEVFVDVPDNHGDLEPDALVYREEDRAAGTVRYWVEDVDTERERYSRSVFATPEWTEQVKHDIKALFAPRDVRLLTPDGNDW